MNLIKWSISLYLAKFLSFYLVFEIFLGVKGVAIHPHGDTASYFNPIFDFFQTGIYNSNYRMPGYGLLLGIFLSLGCGVNVCYFLIILTQHLLSGLAIGLLITELKVLYPTSKIYWVAGFLHFFSPYFLYDFYLSTESITTSILIIITYLGFKKKWPILFGLLCIWAIFLKPILATVIPLAYAYLLSKKVKVLYLILAILPPFFIEGVWIINNYKKSGELILFTSRNFYNEGDFGHLYGAKSLEILVRAYGGSHEYWKINSDISWYYFGGVADPKMIHNMPYPNFNEVIQRSPSREIFTSKFNLDSLKKVRFIATKIYLTSLNSNRLDVKNECKDELNNLTLMCNNYANSIKNEKPWLYFLKANYNRLFNSLYKFELYESQLKILNKNEYLNYIILFIKSLILFPFQFISSLAIIISLYFIFLKAKQSGPLLLSLCNLILLSFYLLFFKQAETRYFMILYPFQIMLCIHIFGKYFKTQK
jgi:hypothetical protein